MILVIECGLAVALVCRLFGHCRQAFYQSKADMQSAMRIPASAATSCG